MKYTNVYGLDEDLAQVAPSQHSALSFDSLTKILSWTKGDGDSCIIVASLVPLTFEPFNGLTYNDREYVESTRGRVVYRGRGVSVDLSELDTDSLVWYIYVFAFNGVQTTEVYNKDAVSVIITAEEAILMETGFNILTETGDNILKE